MHKSKSLILGAIAIMACASIPASASGIVEEPYKQLPNEQSIPAPMPQDDIFDIGTPTKPVAKSTDWDGFYFGATGGWSTGTHNIKDADIRGDIKMDVDGMSFGGLIGYNAQVFDRFVTGLEYDMSWSMVEGDKGYQIDPSTSAKAEGEEVFATHLRARFGYLATDDAMFFGALGAGTSHVEYKTTSNSVSDKKTGYVTGVTVGGGLEYRVMENMNLRTEYLYDHNLYDNFKGFDVEGGKHTVRGALTYSIN